MGTNVDGKSRRALLAGAAMGAVAVAADSAHPAAARAANGQALVIGTTNAGTATTELDVGALGVPAFEVTSESSNQAAIAAFGLAGGIALLGICNPISGQAGTGVIGHSFAGPTGTAGVGVAGQSGDITGAQPGGRTGVLGITDSPRDNAVWGQNLGGGVGVGGSTTSTSTAGVRGVNNGTGYGVRADSAGTGLYTEGAEVAIQVVGTAVFSTSGVAVVPGTTAKPVSKVTASGVKLTPNSFVLATVQQANGNAQVKQAIPNVGAGTVTIILTAPATVHVKVGWFVIN
jgi:hypothetical protein